MSKQGGYRLLAGLAMLVQVVMLFNFFVMGLGWGGPWYVANLIQALGLLIVGGVLIVKKPLLVLPIPVISLLLMALFNAVDPSLKTTDCTPAELAAVAEIPPPPGTGPLDFQSEPENGCIARYNTDVTGPALLDHYRAAAKDAGWSVQEEGEVVVEPGEEAPTSTEPHSLTLNSGTTRVEVMFEPAGEGPAANQLWVVVSVYERR